MNVCDVCSANLESPNGYLLTTRQVVSNPAYWEKAFSRLHELAPLGANVELLKGGLAVRQAEQAKPWLLCADCAGRLGLATREAREYARHWWSSGETFVPPGSGPVPVSEVRLNLPSAEQARPHFPAAGAAGLAVPAGGHRVGTPANAAERRPPKKWTRVLGWICLGWGIMVFIAGIVQMPRPGAAVSATQAVGRPEATREMTPEESASSFMGMGAVTAGIGAWLTLRRRPKEGKRPAIR